MAALDAVLKLRPSSVAPRLADTRVCLLNGRDVQRSLAESAAPLLVCDVPTPALAAGILRAARQARAALGLSFPALPRGEGIRPTAAFQELVAAVQDAGFELPFFLRAGPLCLGEASEAAVSQAREAVFRLVDAGFTEVSFDPSGLAPAEAAAALAEAAVGLRERELAMEVFVRTSDAEALGELAGSLAAQGVRVNAFTIAGSALAHLDDLGSQVEAVAPAALGVMDPAGRVCGTGARRVVASARFCRIAAASLPDAAREQVRARALEGVPVPAAIAAACKESVSLDAEARLRVEALAYHEALELVAAEGARDSALACIAFLAERSGY